MRDKTGKVMFGVTGLTHVAGLLSVTGLFVLSGVALAAGPAKVQEMLELPALPNTPARPPVAAPAPAPVLQTLPVERPSGNAALPVLPNAPEPVRTPQQDAIKPLPKVEVPVIPNNMPALPLPQVSAPAVATAPIEAKQQVPPDYNTNMSLMFTNDDMVIFAQIIKAYDSYEPTKATPTQTTKDDMTDILTGLRDKPQQPEIKAAQNLYLSGIVYYSPSNWLVMVNGRVISSKSNAPNNEFYVSKISRKEVELLWKPVMMGEIMDRWNQMTENGKKAPDNIAIQNGMVRLNLHPNQSFLAKSLTIREGFVRRDVEVAVPSKGDAAINPAPQIPAVPDVETTLPVLPQKGG